MKDHLFVLGRDPELSILELIAYLQKNNVCYSIKEISDLIAVFSIDKNFQPRKAIKYLGGIIKIGRILENLEEVYEGTANKIKYAISAYGKADVKSLNKKIKQNFKEQKLKAFYKKPKKEKALMPRITSGIGKAATYPITLLSVAEPATRPER